MRLFTTERGGNLIMTKSGSVLIETSKKPLGSVFIPSTNCAQLRPDHYDGMRTEGRITVNIGFGLAKLGYDVHLHNIQWPEKQVSDHLWYTHSKSGDYDFAFMFSNYVSNTYYLQQIRAKKYVLIFIDKGTPNDTVGGYASVKYATDNGLTPAQVLLVNPYTNEYKNVFLPYKAKYLPPLFPISDYSTRFVDYSYAPKKPKLVIYSQISVYTPLGRSRIPNLIEKVISTIKNLGYRPKLYLQTYDDTKFNMLNSDDVVFLEQKISYDDMYKMMKQCDFGLVVFHPRTAWGAPHDFISLGKPILGFINGPPTSFYSPLINCKNHIFDFKQYDAVSLESYLKKMIANPYESYSCFRNSMREYEFDVWKDFALEVFSK